MRIHKQRSWSTKTRSNAICNRQDQQRHHSSSRRQSLSPSFLLSSLLLSILFSSVSSIHESSFSFSTYHIFQTNFFLIVSVLLLFSSSPHFLIIHHASIPFLKVGGHNSGYLFQRFVCFESVIRIHQSFNKYRRKFSISMF